MSELVQIESARRSPWIPRAIDNTALDAYMSCPRKFYLAMVKNRRKRYGDGGSPALAYGTTWHAIMEAHYKTGGQTQAVVDAAVASWEPHGNPDDHRTLERCISEYGKFLKEYGTHDQEVAGWGRTVGYDVGSPIVEVPTEIWWAPLIHPYTGKIDRIFEHQGLYYIEDHKSTSAMGDTYFRQFDPSNQMMGYAVLGQEVSGLPIAGVRVNAHAVLKGSSKFKRQLIMFSPERLAEWRANLNIWLGRIETSFQILAEQVEAGVDPTEALLLAFPHNFNACAGKYGQCGFTDVCTYPPDLRDRILEQDYDEFIWNPLNPSDE